MKNILTLVFSILLILCNSCGKYEEKQKEDENKSDFSISASKLFNEFEKDPINADKKYSDKVLEVTGEILSVNTIKIPFLELEYFIDLKINDESSIYSIRFLFKDDEFDSIKNLKINTLIFISGKFKSYNKINVVFDNSKIIKIVEKSVYKNNFDFEMTAEKLYYELFGGLRDKYNNKIIKLTGFFGGVSKIDENIISIIVLPEPFKYLYEGDSPNQIIHCTFNKSFSDKISKLKKNNKIKIIGKCDSDMLQIRLVDCILIN